VQEHTVTEQVCVNTLTAKSHKKCTIPWEHLPYLSASAVVIHYEEALYQVYAPLPFTFTAMYMHM